MTPGADDGAPDRPAHDVATEVAQLGPEWVPGPDGRLFRRGARVLLLDARDRLLLVRGHDQDRPERTWWFTVGGGVDAGETGREAAARELREETGLDVATDALVGPVATRRAVFDFQRRAVRQDEEFYLARVEDPGELTDAGWTDVERSFMDEIRWWDLDDLARVTVEVFPGELVDLVRGLLAGWDGVVRELEPEGDV